MTAGHDVLRCSPEELPLSSGAVVVSIPIHEASNSHLNGGRGMIANVFNQRVDIGMGSQHITRL